LIPIKDNIPTSRFPILTVLLIVANLVVFGWQVTRSSTPGSSTSPHISALSQQDEVTIEYGAIPFRITHPGSECGYTQQQIVCRGQAGYANSTKLNAPPWWVTIFTSMFMHGGILHIAFNMLFLWIFGNNVEDSLGRGRFLIWYVVAGLAAVALQTFITLRFSDAAGASIPNVGASGAIAGVLGAYFVLLPQASVLTLFFFILLREIPAVVFLGLWFVFQLWDGGFSILHPEAGGGVAFFAHIGGFLFGALTIRLVAVRRPLRPAW
jgi:membrane associated rhomboid family serine protease